MSWAAASRAARQGGGRGLQAAADRLLEVSVGVAPFETNELVDSASADLDAASLTAAVSYDTPYAVQQHEDLNDRHDPGRTGKYLEGPLHSEAPTLVLLIAQGVRRGLDQ